MSNTFSIDDIHAIRYENYEKTKEMTHEQLLEHTRKEAAEGLKILESLRANRPSAANQ